MQSETEKDRGTKKDRKRQRGRKIQGEGKIETKIDRERHSYTQRDK